MPPHAPIRPLSLAAALVLAAVIAGVAGAGEIGSAERGQRVLHELRGGVLYHDLDGAWSGFRRESGVDLSAEVVFLRPGFGPAWGRLHPNLGATINTSGDTSKLYAGVLWDVVAPFGLFFDLGVGGAIHDGKLDSDGHDHKELGSRVLFRVAADLGYEFAGHHRLMVSFDHISNAGLASPNQGLDTLGVRYGYRF